MTSDQYPVTNYTVTSDQLGSDHWLVNATGGMGRGTIPHVFPLNGGKNREVLCSVEVCCKYYINLDVLACPALEAGPWAKAGFIQLI